MARFNQTTKERIKKSKKVNEAGGEAFKFDDKYELVNIMLTSFLSDGYYEKNESVRNRLVDLVKKVEPEFVAKLAIYARREFGLRTITHVATAELFKAIHERNEAHAWSKDFAYSVINRPDDITEILSYWYNTEKKLPNALKRGLAKAFSKFNSYKLAKYKSENKSLSLIDAINVLHPPFDTNNGMVTVKIEDYWNAIPEKARNSRYKDFDDFKSTNEYASEFSKGDGTCKIHSFEALKYGLLKNTDTWESKISASGKKDTKEEKAKLESWKELVESGKIGQMALLRNMRNILETGDKDLIDKACTLLTNENRVRKSLIFPFRYFTAYLELQEITRSKKVLSAISKACDIACDNIPEFDDTLIVIDVSGSMSWAHSPKSKATLKQTGAMLGAALYKKGENDLAIFASGSRMVNVDPNSSVLSIVDNIDKRDGCNGHGTDFHAIFRNLKKQYKRVIICTDMQGWIGYNTPEDSVNSWLTRVNQKERPWIYCMNLAAYDSTQFNPNNSRVVNLSGFSEKIFDLMKLAETDRKILISKIEQIEIGS